MKHSLLFLDFSLSHKT